MAIDYKDKRVALIGPAKHITEIDQSKYLKDFDLLVRLNCTFPMPEKLKKATTDRCDVLYIIRRVIAQDEWESVKEIKLRLDALWGFEWFVRTREAQRRFIEKIAPIHPDYEFGLSKKIGCTPNTGLLAMYEILDNNPKELYITGITFKADLEGKDYYDGYNREGRVKIESGLQGFKEHNPEKQLEFFINYIYPKVKVDNKLKQIINEHRSICPN